MVWESRSLKGNLYTLEQVRNIPEHYKKWIAPTLTTLRTVCKWYKKCCQNFNAAYEKYNEKAKQATLLKREKFNKIVNEWRNFIFKKFSNIEALVLDVKSRFEILKNPNESIIFDIYRDVERKQIDNLENGVEKWKKTIRDFVELYIFIDLMANTVEYTSIEKEFKEAIKYVLGITSTF